MTDQTTTRSWTEAPASLTVKFLHHGYDVMLTLRGETGGEVLGKLDQAVTWLAANGASPTAPRGGNGNGKPEPEYIPVPTLPGGAPDPTWCAIHGVAMSRHEKNGQVWFSHKHGESYCKGGGK